MEPRANKFSRKYLSMTYTCPYLCNKFKPFWILPYWRRTLTYTFSTDGSLQYTADEFNDKTGPPWGMKFIYLSGWNEHYNGLNWSLSHYDMTINAYWYRDGVLTGIPIQQIEKDRKYRLEIDSSGKDVIWRIDGREVYRVVNWRPYLGWIHSPYYGRYENPSAVAPHEMRMEINMK